MLEDLVRAVDAVYSNLRGDYPKRLRITYEDLKDVNPRIVCCSLSGFGMTGPRAGRGRLRLHDAGARRLDEPHRRARRAADEERALARRPLRRLRVRDRAPGRALAGSARRRRVRLRRLALRDGAARAHVRRHVGRLPRLRAGAALGVRPPVDRPVPELPDRATAGSWSPARSRSSGSGSARRSGAPDLAADPRFADFAGRHEHRDELVPELRKVPSRRARRTSGSPSSPPPACRTPA